MDKKAAPTPVLTPRQFKEYQDFQDKSKRDYTNSHNKFAPINDAFEDFRRDTVKPFTQNLTGPLGEAADAAVHYLNRDLVSPINDKGMNSGWSLFDKGDPRYPKRSYPGSEAKSPGTNLAPLIKSPGATNSPGSAISPANVPGKSPRPARILPSTQTAIPSNTYKAISPKKPIGLPGANQSMLPKESPTTPTAPGQELLPKHFPEPPTMKKVNSMNKQTILDAAKIAVKAASLMPYINEVYAGESKSKRLALALDSAAEFFRTAADTMTPEAPDMSADANDATHLENFLNSRPKSNSGVGLTSKPSRGGNASGKQQRMTHEELIPHFGPQHMGQYTLDGHAFESPDHALEHFKASASGTVKHPTEAKTLKIEPMSIAKSLGERAFSGAPGGKASETGIKTLMAPHVQKVNDAISKMSDPDFVSEKEEKPKGFDYENLPSSRMDDLGPNTKVPPAKSEKVQNLVQQMSHGRDAAGKSLDTVSLMEAFHDATPEMSAAQREKMIPNHLKGEWSDTLKAMSDRAAETTAKNNASTTNDKAINKRVEDVTNRGGFSPDDSTYTDQNAISSTPQMNEARELARQDNPKTPQEMAKKVKNMAGEIGKPQPAAGAPAVRDPRTPNQVNAPIPKMPWSETPGAGGVITPNAPESDKSGKANPKDVKRIMDMADDKISKGNVPEEEEIDEPIDVSDEDEKRGGNEEENEGRRKSDDDLIGSDEDDEDENEGEMDSTKNRSRSQKNRLDNRASKVNEIRTICAGMSYHEYDMISEALLGMGYSVNDILAVADNRAVNLENETEQAAQKTRARVGKSPENLGRQPRTEEYKNIDRSTIRKASEGEDINGSSHAVMDAAFYTEPTEDAKRGLRAKQVLNDFLTKQAEENPCWEGYKMVGKKKKNGKEVPNCVPKSKSASLLNEFLTKQAEEDPCWEDYEMVGTKKKNGKEVPNCVPKSKAATMLNQFLIKQAEEEEDPCWKDYEMIGTKKKNGKEVPNCVPKSKAASVLDDFLKKEAAGVQVSPGSGGNYSMAPRTDMSSKTVIEPGQGAYEPTFTKKTKDKPVPGYKTYKNELGATPRNGAEPITPEQQNDLLDARFPGGPVIKGKTTEYDRYTGPEGRRGPGNPNLPNTFRKKVPYGAGGPEELPMSSLPQKEPNMFQQFVEKAKNKLQQVPGAVRGLVDGASPDNMDKAINKVKNSPGDFVNYLKGLHEKTFGTNNSMSPDELAAQRIKANPPTQKPIAVDTKGNAMVAAIEIRGLVKTAMLEITAADQYHLVVSAMKSLGYSVEDMLKAYGEI